MVESLISKAELLPADETVEEHRRLKEEETQCVEKDKANKDKRTGGLFLGCFRQEPPTRRAIRDEEDGVDRCPVCNWELEDSRCGQCGLSFGSDGSAVLGRGSFSSVSDYESTIAYLSDEDIDADLDMEDAASELGFEYGSASGISYPSSLDSSSIYSLQIQRAMASGNIQRPSRPASRSSYGSRVRRYSQSVISDIFTSEDGSMATVEEEEEDEDEDMDSMADFIADDDSGRNAPGSYTPSPRAVPRQGVTAIDLRSPALGVASLNGDEFDEGGAISNGIQRRRFGQGSAPRRNQRFGPIALSISTDAESDMQELDEDTESLLRHPYSRLDHDDGDDAMEFDPEEDDDDDAKTTVGASPPPYGSERTRLGGSVTPTAIQSSAAIRPPSRSSTRTGSSIGLHGLRRKGSSISVNNYEDGEADDDDSEVEAYFNPQTGDNGDDVEMDNNLNGTGRRLSSSSVIRLSSAEPESPNQGVSLREVIDIDSDSASDVPARSQRRRRPQSSRTPEYNARISMMFAQHQSELNNIGSTRRGNELEGRETPQRSRTPIIRPRTANRNRPAASPIIDINDSAFATAVAAGNPATSRARSGSQSNWSSTDLSSNAAGADRARTSSQARTATIPGLDGAVDQRIIHQSSDTSREAILGTDSEVHHGNNRINTNNSGNIPTRMSSSIERPPSRASVASVISPSQGRLGGIQSRPVGHFLFPTQRHGNGFVQNSPGFNHHLQPNPWSHLIQPRQSHARLRETPSTSTLRARHSRSYLRNNPSHSSVRDNTNSIPRQRSRASLAHAASQQRLRNQPSARTLQSGQSVPDDSLQNSVSTHASVPPSNIANLNKGIHGRLSDEERIRRGQELMRQRQEELTSQRQSRPEINPSTSSRRSPEFIMQRRLSSAADQGASFSARSEASRASSADPIMPTSLGRQQPRRGSRSSIPGQPPIEESVPYAASATRTGNMRTGPGTAMTSQDSVSPPRSPLMPRVR
jgi:hypothetical protein